MIAETRALHSLALGAADGNAADCLAEQKWKSELPRRLSEWFAIERHASATAIQCGSTLLRWHSS
eukprot:2583550-Amphidinium_carterae.1